MSQQGSIDSVLHEDRVFPPPPEFSAAAHVGSMEAYEALCREAESDPEGFWAGLRRNCTGSSVGTRCWNGIRRSPSGFPAGDESELQLSGRHLTTRAEQGALIWSPSRARCGR